MRLGGRGGEGTSPLGHMTVRLRLKIAASRTKAGLLDRGYNICKSHFAFSPVKGNAYLLVFLDAEFIYHADGLAHVVCAVRVRCGLVS